MKKMKAAFKSGRGSSATESFPPSAIPQTRSQPISPARSAATSRQPMSTDPAAEGQESHSMNTFNYDPLDKMNPSIRLVGLITGAAGIQLKMFTVRLDQAPAYEALSYCWGPSNPKHQVSVNGGSFDVNPNLFSALQVLKSIYSFGEPGEEVAVPPMRLLWIDAICINQDDVGERNHQVRLMWYIYSCAERVLAWLGEEAEQSQRGMEMVRLLALRGELDIHERIRAMSLEDSSGVGPSTGRSPSTPQQPDKQDPALASTKEQKGDDKSISFFHMGGNYEIRQGSAPTMPSHDPDNRIVASPEEEAQIPFYMLWAVRSYSNKPDPEAWTAFTKLMERPWWYRVWCIQEIAAAKTALVGCGKSWLKWDRFMFADSAISTYKDRPGLERLHRLGRGTKAISDKVVLSVRKDGRLNDWTGLLSLLFTSQDYFATDPRDRIFSVLGFAPDIDITPDYTINVEQLYQKVVRDFIRNTRNLAILILNRNPKNRKLPTWCPDFSLSLPEEVYNVRCPMGFFGADGNNWHNMGMPSPSCSLDPNDSPGELTVTGFTYDTPQAIGRVWSSPIDGLQSSVFPILDQYERLLNNTDREHFSDKICHHRTEDFWRTLIWNASSVDRYPVTKQYGDCFKELREKMHYIMPLDDSDLPKQPISQEMHGRYRAVPVGKASVYYDAFVRNGLNRRFFVSKKGHLGSGPPDMRATDVICILLGSKTPVVLRKVEGSPLRYAWIGQCYMHGIMHGEALGSLTTEVDPNNILAQRKLSLQQICLV